METQSYRVKHILVDEVEDAREILLMYKYGQSFEDLAREYSECDSKNKGGDIGSFTKGQLDASFERAFFGLRPGEVSIPIQTKHGFHLIYRIR
jgi:peptidyl-prolyl cis-trans isomerase C